MPSSSSSGEDNFCIASRTKKGKRGPVYMAKLVKEHTMKGTKLTVQFDDRCDPRGDNATTWRSYLCMLARSRVPITFSDWRKVPSHYKETLWRDATVSLFKLYLVLVCDVLILCFIIYNLLYDFSGHF